MRPTSQMAKGKGADRPSLTNSSSTSSGSSVNKDWAHWVKLQGKSENGGGRCYRYRTCVRLEIQGGCHEQI